MLKGWRMRRLKGLQKRVATALSFVVDAINDLEQVNNKYEKEMEKISQEIEHLTMTHLAVHEHHKSNLKTIEKFKNLLG